MAKPRFSYHTLMQKGKNKKGKFNVNCKATRETEKVQRGGKRGNAKAERKVREANERQRNIDKKE